MKQAILLIILASLFSLAATAQTTTVEKNAKRITITTTKTDESGKAVTETWIAEGDQPEKILEGMAVNPDVLQKMNTEDQISTENGERLFLIRSAGDKEVIEGRLGEADGRSGALKPRSKQAERIIIIDNSDKAADEKFHQKIYHSYGGPTGAAVWAKAENERINCAALGVYVDHSVENESCTVSALIEKGGAKEAGILAGDVITKIDRYEVTDFPSLHDALSNYLPGDVVTVRYQRGDKSEKARVELKDWAQLPGHEWRARTDCGQPPVTEEENAIIDTPDSPSNVKELQLQDAQVFPNPTEGAFALSFTAEPGPLTISVTDANGKVIYHENNDNTTGSYHQNIDLKGLPQGNYIISVTQGDKVYTNQINKQ
jgi:hypothetical protein